MEEKKRLFFAFDVLAPWSDEPAPRMVPFDNRHLTLAFLGECRQEPLLREIANFPEPFFNVGRSGRFDRLLLLPESDPKALAYHGHFYSDEILEYQESLGPWLKERGYRIDHRPFLPHVTVARSPFDRDYGHSAFQPLPFVTRDLHLYESLGHSQYRVVWSLSLQPPFVEMPHTADLAFHVFGEDLDQIFLNAATALAFHYPPLVAFIVPKACPTLDDIIIGLNDLISTVDRAIGIPLKAVSFHGSLQEREGEILMWDMIVDV